MKLVRDEIRTFVLCESSKERGVGNVPLATVLILFTWSNARYVAGIENEIE